MTERAAPSETRIRAVLFDLDGTLVDNMPYHIDAWIELGQQLGHELTRERVQREFSGRLNSEILRDVLGHDFTQAEVAHWAAIKEERYRALYAPHLSLLDGAEDFLALLKARGIAAGIASAAPAPNRAFVIDSLGLRDHVSVVVGAEEVARGKPAPDLFLEGARRLSIAPEHVLVFEDAVLGVQAARAAGMRACGITSAESADTLIAAGALAAAPSFRMLPEAITRLF